MGALGGIAVSYREGQKTLLIGTTLRSTTADGVQPLLDHKVHERRVCTVLRFLKYAKNWCVNLNLSVKAAPLGLRFLQGNVGLQGGRNVGLQGGKRCWATFYSRSGCGLHITAVLRSAKTGVCVAILQIKGQRKSSRRAVLNVSRSTSQL